MAFNHPFPSFHRNDMAVGVISAVVIRIAVHTKRKNAKKYRQGVEYGSARWETPKDIASFIDPVFENNILLTQTARQQKAFLFHAAHDLHRLILRNFDISRHKRYKELSDYDKFIVFI